MTVKGKKYPHFIYLKGREIFSIAGIWSEWLDGETGGLLHTYSILTTAANPFVEKIHNIKKRMPVILDREKEGVWLDRNLPSKGIRELMAPFEAARMNAHPVSRLITSRGEVSNTKRVQQPFDYPELNMPR
jgi:putative SOS response-associated peptidase YedK